MKQWLINQHDLSKWVWYNSISWQWNNSHMISCNFTSSEGLTTPRLGVRRFKSEKWKNFAFSGIFWIFWDFFEIFGFFGLFFWFFCQFFRIFPYFVDFGFFFLQIFWIFWIFSGFFKFFSDFFRVYENFFEWSTPRVIYIQYLNSITIFLSVHKKLFIKKESCAVHQILLRIIRFLPQDSEPELLVAMWVFTTLYIAYYSYLVYL